jgi:hypothetical protein
VSKMPSSAAALMMSSELDSSNTAYQLSGKVGTSKMFLLDSAGILIGTGILLQVPVPPK